MDLDVAAQAHDVAPAGIAAEPGQQLIAGERTIRQ